MAGEGGYIRGEVDVGHGFAVKGLGGGVVNSGPRFGDEIPGVNVWLYGVRLGG